MRYALVESGRVVKTRDTRRQPAGWLPVEWHTADYDPDLYEPAGTETDVYDDRVVFRDVVEPKPARLTVDDDRITAGDTTTVTYRDAALRSQSVTFTVNGDDHRIPLVDGTATLRIGSESPGRVRVACEGLQVIVNVDIPGDGARSRTRSDPTAVYARRDPGDERVDEMVKRTLGGGFGKVDATFAVEDFEAYEEHVAERFAEVGVTVRELAEMVKDLRDKVDALEADAGR